MEFLLQSITWQMCMHSLICNRLILLWFQAITIFQCFTGNNFGIRPVSQCIVGTHSRLIFTVGVQVCQLGLRCFHVKNLGFFLRITIDPVLHLKHAHHKLHLEWYNQFKLECVNWLVRCTLYPRGLPGGGSQFRWMFLGPVALALRFPGERRRPTGAKLVGLMKPFFWDWAISGDLGPAGRNWCSN